MELFYLGGITHIVQKLLPHFFATALADRYCRPITHQEAVSTVPLYSFHVDQVTLVALKKSLVQLEGKMSYFVIGFKDLGIRNDLQNPTAAFCKNH